MAQHVLISVLLRNTLNISFAIALSITKYYLLCELMHFLMNSIINARN